jgi:hypothetical protein
VAAAGFLVAAAPGAVAAEHRAVRPAAAAGSAYEPSLSLQVSVTGMPAAAVIGRNDSLWYLTGRSGRWHRTELARAGSAFGGPSLYLTSAPAAEIAVQGASHTLVLYYQSHGHWRHRQIAGPGRAYSAPSLYIGHSGPGIAVSGPSHALWYYWSVRGRWHSHQVSRSGTDFSAPSLAIRAANENEGKNKAGQAVIAVQGAGHALDVYRSTAHGGWPITRALGRNHAYSAPSLVIGVGPLQGNADVAVEGPHNCVIFTGDTLDASRPGVPSTLDTHDVFSAPSLAQDYEDPSGQLEMVFQGLATHAANFLYLTGSGWVNDPLPGTYPHVDSAPALALNDAGVGYGVIFQGPGNSLYYYQAPRGAGPAFTGRRVAGTGTTFGG